MVSYLVDYFLVNVSLFCITITFTLTNVTLYFIFFLYYLDYFYIQS